MKLKMIPTNKLAILSAAFCAVMLAFSYNAKATTTLDFGDSYDLGSITPDGGGDATRTTYLNVLIGVTPGTTFTDGGQTYVRTGNDFGTLPTAVFALNGPGASPQDQTVSIDLGSGGYTYLYAKYDGPNFGAEVWDVSGLTGIVTIPNFAGPDGQLQLSGWTLFTGGAVPDGGTTVMLLGAALGALGMARRFLKR